LKRFFDDSQPLLDPRTIVRVFTKKESRELQLPRRAIITFQNADARRLTDGRESSVVEAWTPFRTLYRLSGTETVVARSFIGGPNVAALVEELSAFGVEEFVLWGYCGGIAEDSAIGEIYLARSAMREDGISYHYLDSEDDYVLSDWADDWTPVGIAAGFRVADIWSIDAIYRETEKKIRAYAQRGIAGVEMEVASLYAVCKAKGLKGIAFLVVSDVFTAGKWVNGFHGKLLREGVKRMARFMGEEVSR